MNRKSLLPRLLLAVCLLAFALPVAAILVLSLLRHDGSAWQWSMEQYAALLEEKQLLQRFVNSGKITMGSLLLQLPVSLAFAVFLSRLEGNIRGLLLAALLVMLLLPFQTYMLPIFQLCRAIGLYNTHWALILLETFSPHGPLVLYAFLRGLPEEQWEAARLETSSLGAVVRRVLLPQMLPALGFLLLFGFAEAWNLVEPAVILLQHDELKPVSVSLNDFHDVSWAGAALYMLPVLLGCLVCLPVFRSITQQKGPEYQTGAEK